jgi:hypothetical protein
MYRWVDHTSEVELELHAPSGQAHRLLYAQDADGWHARVVLDV